MKNPDINKQYNVPTMQTCLNLTVGHLAIVSDEWDKGFGISLWHLIDLGTPERRPTSG